MKHGKYDYQLCCFICDKKLDVWWSGEKWIDGVTFHCCGDCKRAGKDKDE